MLLLWLDSCVSLRVNALTYKLSLSLDQIPLLVVLAVYVQGPAKNSYKAAQSILAWNYSYFYADYLITNLNIGQLAWYLLYMSSFTICIFNFIPAHPDTHFFSHKHMHTFFKEGNWSVDKHNPISSPHHTLQDNLLLMSDL